MNMENDIQAIKDKYDTKIADLRAKLDELVAKRQSAIEQIKIYYEALEAKENAEKIISRGKPLI